tara:strand:+ start:703 stop:933 length:231 start_codon:yes stop_codon:yes gene_type:complete
MYKKIEKGKYYKGNITGIIIKATSNGDINGMFSAEVIEQAKSDYSVGSISSGWLCGNFTETVTKKPQTINELFPIY